VTIPSVEYGFSGFIPTNKRANKQATDRHDPKVVTIRQSISKEKERNSVSKRNKEKIFLHLVCWSIVFQKILKPRCM